MTTFFSLRRRLADAACAFETGHSVRDLDRSLRRRISLLSERNAARLEREAFAVGGEPAAASMRSRAASLRETCKRYLHRLDGDAEARVLGLLDIYRVQQARSRWEETSSLEGIESPDDRGGAGVDAVRVLPREFAAQLYKGLFEDPSFYLGLNEHLIGAWNWHRFLRFLRRSVGTSFKGFLQARALAIARACGPP